MAHEATNTGPQEGTLKCPPDSAWFMLHKRNPRGAWERCERADWGSNSKWWRVAELDPILVASEGFGPGTYRATWRAEDKRRHRGYSQPFEIRAAINGATPPSVQPEIPHSQNHAPQPSALGGLAPLLGSDPTGPVALFLLLKQMASEDNQRLWEQMRQQHELAIMQERTRTELTLEHMRSHYQTMTTGQMTLAHQLELAREREEHARQLPLANQLTALSQRIESLTQRSEESDDDEDDDEPVAMLASAQPNDLERVVNGFVMALNSPIGKALAAALVKKMGVPVLPAGEEHAQDAAE